MKENLIVPVNLADSIPRPSEDQIARRGARRLVKLVPTPFGGRPAIWTSPYIVVENIDGVFTPCLIAVVLVQAEPKPETQRVFVPKDLYEKLADVPVEW
jgi:hypothetical protein